MARGKFPKLLTISILALSIALVLVSAQPSNVAAGSISPQSTWTWTSHTHHNSSYDCSGYYSYYCSYYYYYPYYSYYYGYPYYYSSYYGSYGHSSTPSSYTLTVGTNPSTLGTVTGSGTYTAGASASFSVTQNTVQVSPN